MSRQFNPIRGSTFCACLARLGTRAKAGERGLHTVMRLIFTLLAGVLISAPALADAPMTFFMETSQESRFYALTRGGVFDIYAAGDITEGTTDKLLAFVRANKLESAKIHFNSPGGSLAEGMRLGRAIRALQFHTTIGIYNPKYIEGANKGAICASACAYAFAGGMSRFLDQYTGQLGVHQFYLPNNAAISSEAVQQVSGLIVAYLDEMGVDAKAFTISTAADRDGMFWLTPDVALRLRFANNGVEPPVAEIKLSGMRPYLRIQQDFHNVTTRVLFNCDRKNLSMLFGIVTNPETSGMIMTFPKRSYLELDNKEFLVIPGATGAEATDSVVWISRNLTPVTVAQLTNAMKVDGWVDGSGAVRWGAQLDIPTVRGKILDYARQCFEG